MSISFDKVVTFILIIDLLTIFISPITLFLLSEILDANTFEHHIFMMLFCYPNIVMMGIVFGIPGLFIICILAFIFRLFRFSWKYQRIYILVTGLFLILLLCKFFGYRYYENEDLVWVLAYTMTYAFVTLTLKIPKSRAESDIVNKE